MPFRVISARNPDVFLVRLLVFGSYLFWSVAANCEVYKCNEFGRLVYSDTPCRGANIPSDVNGSGADSLRDGLAAYSRGDFKNAYLKLAPHADKGVALAQNTLGRMYLKGDGVAKDSKKAFKLFQKAANSGFSAAQNNLGVMYMAGDAVKQDFARAQKYFRSAASQGFSPAMLNLAEMYAEGFGVVRDPAEAARWKAKARAPEADSARDVVTAQFSGSGQFDEGMNRYYKGDYVGAAPLIQKAAELGHPEAQLRLSLMYREGQGVPKDLKKGDYWERKAKAKGRQMDDGQDRVIVNLLPPGDPRLTPPPIPKPTAAPERGMCPTCGRPADSQ